MGFMRAYMRAYEILREFVRVYGGLSEFMSVSERFFERFFYMKNLRY